MVVLKGPGLGQDLDLQTSTDCLQHEVCPRALGMKQADPLECPLLYSPCQVVSRRRLEGWTEKRRG